MGKVILGKILLSCPDVNTIYVLVRAKRNKKPIDRIKNEILNSPNFKVLKTKMGAQGFIEFAESKIVPIVGDLIVDKLGMSDHDRNLLIENCHVIINSAASVNFDDPLQDAL